MADHYQATYSWVRRHITLVIFLVLGVPFIMVIAIVYFTGYQYIKNSIIHQAGFELADTAVEVRSDLDAGITGLCKALSFIGASESLSGLKFEQDLESVFAWLEKESGDVFQDLAVVAPDGRVLAGVFPHGRDHADFSREEWFPMSCQEQVVVSDVYYDSRMNPYFIISVLSGHEQEQIMLIASVNGLWLSSFVENIGLGRTGEAFVVNSNGIVQTRSRMGKDFGQKTDMVFLESHPDGTVMKVFHEQGVEMLAAITRLKSNSSWFMVVGQEKEEAIEDVNIVRVIFILIVILGVLFIVIIGFLTSRLLMKRIRQADEKKCEIDEQLIQSQKLAAIGQLSSGVAHEINNPLAVIGEEAGWLQDLMKNEDVRDFKHAEEFRDSLQAIVEQVRRCKEVTHKLLSFARKMDSHFMDVDLREIVDEVVDMREQDAFLDNISIEKEFDKDLPVIFSEPYLLRQLLLNLVNNAVDAVQKGGKIVVQTRMEGRDKVLIRVKDNGVGIPRENLSKIFDPFFTTKPPGKGTGLGLSTCHGIINKLGGEILVDSEVNKGSTFTVVLPVKAASDAETGGQT